MPQELASRFTDAAPLGAGAMGGVFAATDERLGRRVAVKVLHAPDADEIAIRFLREAETLARIQHPNVLAVLDHGRTAEGPYMVMELLEGAPLDKPPSDLDLLQVARDLSCGLEAVHAMDVVHRDVKPANVMWARPGRAVLIDFGLVHDPGKTALTRTGTLVGTPAYMSPEILMGESLSASSDWYALGITLYELAEGKRPYGMEDINRIFANEGLPPLEFSRLAEDSPLRHLILALTAHDPEDRPASSAAIEEILTAGALLHQDLDQEPTRPIGSANIERPGADTGPHGPQWSQSQVPLSEAPSSRALPFVLTAVGLSLLLGLAPWEGGSGAAGALPSETAEDARLPRSP
jgi:serine/threonine protein kinase